jgi:hypothetical protein
MVTIAFMFFVENVRRPCAVRGLLQARLAKYGRERAKRHLARAASCLRQRRRSRYLHARYDADRHSYTVVVSDDSLRAARESLLRWRAVELDHGLRAKSSILARRSNTDIDRAWLLVSERPGG